MEPIKFIELDDTNFQENIEKFDFCLVDFYATWCGSCRMAASLFLKLAQEYNLPVFKVDAEKNPQARHSTSVPSLPTLALYKKGVSLGSVSATKREALEGFLNQHCTKPAGEH